MSGINAVYAQGYEEIQTTTDISDNVTLGYDWITSTSYVAVSIPTWELKKHPTCEYCGVSNILPENSEKILAVRCGACGAPLKS